MGQTVPELDIGVCPTETVYIWNIFADLRKGVQDRITYTDIDAYCRLYKMDLEPFELNVVMALEQAYWSTK